MKILFVIFILFACLLALYGIGYNKTDKNGYFKFNWPFAAAMVLLVVSPIIAKFCEII